MSLYNLPNEILLVIFNDLNTYSLTQLACVCRRFNLLVSEPLIKKSNHLLVTNQMSEKFRKRCKPLLFSYSSKFITHYNWINGICKKRQIYEKSWSYEHGTDIKMIQNRLWFFGKKNLYAYDRAEDGTVKKNEEDIAIQSCDSTICAIVCCNDVIISGHKDGSIRHWRIESRDNKNYFQLLKVHSKVHDSIYTIDATSQYIASSSVRGSIKIQKNTYEEDVSAEGNKIFNRYNSVMSIAFDPIGTKLAAALTNFDDYSSYIIYDINTNHSNEIDAKDGICNQLLWEDPHTILMYTCKNIKKMDLRTSKFVRTWEPELPYLTCFSSDNLYTIMTGTFCSEALLWDQRKSAPIRAYNINAPGSLLPDNKVLSVSFDSSHLYLALHTNILYEFDFKGENFTAKK